MTIANNEIYYFFSIEARKSSGNCAKQMIPRSREDSLLTELKTIRVMLFEGQNRQSQGQKIL